MMLELLFGGARLVQTEGANASPSGVATSSAAESNYVRVAHW